MGAGITYWRLWVVVVVFGILLAALVARLIDLVTVDRAFLLRQSDARSSRIVNIPAYRGMIVDRNDKPLAVTIPIESVWVDASSFELQNSQCVALSRIFGSSCQVLRKQLQENHNRSFWYIKRHVAPEKVDEIKALNIAGVNFQTEYKRYYPEGEIMSQLIGFTNVDDKGQEGLELAYDRWLAGMPGKNQVLKDRLGRVMANKKALILPQPGRVLQLSIDHHLQYVAYHEIERGVKATHAQSGSAVVLDVRTGEVLAMVNYPSFNPNLPRQAQGKYYRNRAVTDVFEPGSTMKAFSVVNILESGQYTAKSLVDVGSGQFTIEGQRIQDVGRHQHGKISLAQVVKHSSNVGIAKLTLSLPAPRLIEVLKRFGFGASTYSGFPGEASGSLAAGIEQRKFDLATLSFGYGVSVSALQLARAFLIIANDGVDRAISFAKIDQPKQLNRVIDTTISQQLLSLLSHVTEKGGTGFLGHVDGYRVAGKTGTAHKSKGKGYAQDKYLASFIGVAPVEAPRRVVVIVIDEPDPKTHFGGRIAAPIFAKIMSRALMMRAA